jgi:hypothetical protein
MDTSSIIFFAFIFIMGFVASIMGLAEFANSLEKKKPPYLGLICCFIALVVWFPFTIVWFTNADLTMYFGFGYLWLALGFIFVALSIISAGLILRYSTKPEEKEALTIKERVM